MAERFFKLSGNFEQDGKWATPDPSFRGSIMVGSNNFFKGYSKELYAAAGNEVRYIIGYLKSMSPLSVCFYKLSNTEDQAPLIYVVSESKAVAEWAAPLFGYMTRQGSAIISLTLQKVIEGEEKVIETAQKSLLLDINYNGEIIGQIDFCKHLLLNL